ncbi:helix-turn-helix domain-containing protein [Pseudonocardia ailaonensis]
MANAPGLSVAARIAAHLERDTSALLERVAATYRRNPGYSGFDHSTYQADVMAVSAANLRLLAQRLRGQQLAEDDIAIIAESGARRMTQQVPEAEVGRAYRLWSMAVWTEITEAAREIGDIDAADVVPLAAVVLEHNEYVGGLAADAYEGESRGIWVQTTRLDDVTMGELVTGTAQREQIEALRLQCLGDRADGPVTLLAVTTRERGAGITAGNAAVRQVVDSCRRAADTRIFVGVVDRDVILIGQPPEPERWISDLGAFGLQQVAMVHLPSLGSFRSGLIAVPEAREMLAAARALPARRTPYTWRETVLTAIGMTAPPGFAARLRNSLVRIVEYEERRGTPLRQTLHVHLDNGESVTRTADALFCHPNTVRHRLGRISALTGLDPANSTDLAVLAIALALAPSAGPRTG